MSDDFNLATEPTGAFTSFEEATQYLEKACARMKVNHLAYSLVHSIDGTPDHVSWIATYDPAYMSHYLENYTQLGDPTFEIAFTDNAVVDWVELLALDSMWQELLPMAERYGITKYGISLPLRDGEFGNVLFSVNVKSNDEEWITLRDSLVARFRPFAHYFHGRVRPLIESRKFAEIHLTD